MPSGISTVAPSLIFKEFLLRSLQKFHLRFFSGHLSFIPQVFFLGFLLNFLQIFVLQFTIRFFQVRSEVPPSSPPGFSPKGRSDNLQRVHSGTDFFSRISPGDPSIFLEILEIFPDIFCKISPEIPSQFPRIFRGSSKEFLLRFSIEFLLGFLLEIYLCFFRKELLLVSLLEFFLRFIQECLL